MKILLTLTEIFNICNYVYLYITLLSVLREVHWLYHRQFSTERDITPPPFNFQYPLFCFRLFSSGLRFLPRHLVTSILPSILPSTKCFTRKFLHKMWPIHLAFLLIIICMIFLFLTLCNISSFLTGSAQLIFSIVLEHHISELSRYFWCSEVSKFQHHIKLHFKSSTLLVFSVNFSPIYWWKESSSWLMLLLPRKFWI